MALYLNNLINIWTLEYICERKLYQGNLINVSGELPRPRKIAPNPMTNPKPNPNPNKGAIFLGGNCMVAPNPKTKLDLDPNPDS